MRTILILLGPIFMANSAIAQSIFSRADSIGDTANVCYKNGQYYEGISLYTEAIELLDNSYSNDSVYSHLKLLTAYYYYRGLCFRAIDRHEAAILDLYKCETYYKQDVDIHKRWSPRLKAYKWYIISTYAIASSLFELGQYQKAILELDTFLSVHTIDGTYSLRGQAKLKLDDFQGAIKDFDSAIENGADDKGFLTYLKALAKLKSNAFDVDEACSDFWEAYNDYGYMEAKSMFSTVCIY